MLIRVGGEFRGIERRILPSLKIKILEYNRILNTPYNILNHPRTLGHLLLNVPKTLNGTPTVLNEIIDA